MSRSLYRNRRAASIENDRLRVTVLEEGGHIAEFFDKRTNINPLWTPAWPSIEPSTFDARIHEATYGQGAEARLLAGIMGHNVCLDFFGAPSDAEAEAGLTVHGEASVVPYSIDVSTGTVTLRADLPVAQLSFERQITLDGRAVRIAETIENHAACDRPIGWTQHVTLGPPFLEKGATVFRASAVRSQVLDATFGADGHLQPGAEFDWPLAPARTGGPVDLQVFTSADRSSAYTTHLMDPRRPHAWFLAFSPRARIAFGYIWQQADFPWLGIWEENASRQSPPWKGRTLTRGMEFGVSPFPESRRQMIDRGELFGVPGYRWVPARGRLRAEYWAVALEADATPEVLHWPGC